MKTRLDAKSFIKKKEAQFQADLLKQKTISFKDINRKGRHSFLRVAWTFMPQSNLKDDKIFIIERLQKISTDGEIAYKDFWKEGDIEYRIGYYIVGKNGNKKDTWTWGQYCPLIPKEDLKALFKKAKKEKTL